jgi:hypothetical protein
MRYWLCALCDWASSSRTVILGVLDPLQEFLILFKQTVDALMRDGEAFGDDRHVVLKLLARFVAQLLGRSAIHWSLTAGYHG